MMNERSDDEASPADQAHRRRYRLIVASSLLLAAGATAIACDTSTDETVETKRQNLTAAWSAGVAYQAGDSVTHSGATYTCLQAHTSLDGWEPPNVPALWEVVAGNTTQDHLCDTSPEACCPEGTILRPLSSQADIYHSAEEGVCVAAMAGDDTVFLDSDSPAALSLGSGNDTAYSGNGNDLVLGGPGNDVIHAHGGTNFLSGGFGNDTITATGGKNTVHPGPGADTVHLGDDDDTLIIANVCEIAWGDTFDGGGGHNTLQTPVPLDELAALGVTVAHFDSVIVDDTRSCYSECAEETCDRPDEEPAVPTLLPAELGPAPSLSGADDLDTFLTWFYRIRKSELEEARQAIANVSNDAQVVASLIQRFETARDDRSRGTAMMLIVFISAMESPEAEETLLNLLAEPISYQDDGTDVTSRYDDEIAYRRQAIYGLGGRDSAVSKQALLDAALGHSDQKVRASAIRTLAYGMATNERAELRDAIRVEDQFFVDRPNSTDADFEQRYQQMQQLYAQ